MEASCKITLLDLLGILLQGQVGYKASTLSLRQPVLSTCGTLLWSFQGKREQRIF